MSNVRDIQDERFHRYITKLHACSAAGDWEGCRKLDEEREAAIARASANQAAEDAVDALWILLGYGAANDDDAVAPPSEAINRYRAAYALTEERLGPIAKLNALSEAHSRFNDYEISLEQLADKWGMPRDVLQAAVAEQIAHTDSKGDDQ